MGLGIHLSSIEGSLSRESEGYGGHRKGGTQRRGVHSLARPSRGRQGPNDPALGPFWGGTPHPGVRKGSRAAWRGSISIRGVMNRTDLGQRGLRATVGHAGVARTQGPKPLPPPSGRAAGGSGRGTVHLALELVQPLGPSTGARGTAASQPQSVSRIIAYTQPRRGCRHSYNHLAPALVQVLL